MTHDVCFKHNRSPLHGACSRGHIETVALLIEHHANVEAFDEVQRYNATTL